MGWAGIKNGDLLALAEKELDAFVTVDRKISTQQNLTNFKIRYYCFAHGPIGWKTFVRSCLS